MAKRGGGLSEADAAAAEAEAAEAAAAAAAAAEVGREPGDIVIALSPRQIIGGFALLAGLIIMVRRRRRKG